MFLKCDNELFGSISISLEGFLFEISIYKLGDVGISSNMIGSLSLTNGQCRTPREVDNETMTGVNFLLPK